MSQSLATTQRSSPTSTSVLSTGQVPLRNLGPQIAVVNRIDKHEELRRAAEKIETGVIIVPRDVPAYAEKLAQLTNEHKIDFSGASNTPERLADAVWKYLRVRKGISQGLIDPAWLDDLKSIVSSFKAITDARTVHVWLQTIQPLQGETHLHIDWSKGMTVPSWYSPFRLLCSYYGTGTDYVTDDNLKVTRDELMNGGLRIRDIVVDEGRIYQTPPNAVVIIRTGENGIVHRGSISMQPRLRLRMDVGDPNATKV